MKGNNEILKPTTPCCDKGVTEINQNFVVEENTVVISEGVSAGEADSDLFD